MGPGSASKGPSLFLLPSSEEEELAMEVGLKNNGKGENKRIKEESTRGQRSAEGGQGWDVAEW